MTQTMTDQKLQWTSQAPERTVAFGALLARILKPGDVIALQGPLGAGKTQFTRGVAAGLDVDERLVSSPTFVLMCEYPGKHPVIHIDAYRMQGLSDLESLGWSDELLEGAVTLIEWADRIAGDLPENHLRVDLSHEDDSLRMLELQPHGAWGERRELLERIIGMMSPTTRCPTCGGSVTEASKAFPFCSKRCRMADLNQWFDEGYRISRPISQRRQR